MLAAVLLAGCSGADSSGAMSMESDVALPAAPADAGDPAAETEPDRQVVTTASASVVVGEPAEAAQQLSQSVEDVGGRVEERTEQSATDEGRDAVADLVVRVPADELTGVLAGLDDLGEVTERAVTRTDRTSDAVDLDARISALQTSVERLQALLAGAATTEALLDAERALSERQAEVESLQSRRALLADEVQLSTLSVHLGSAPVVEPVEERGGFLDGLATGWSALVSALGIGVLVLGVLLPWLLLGAVVAGAAWAVARQVRERRPHPGAAEAAEAGEAAEGADVERAP
ncbi:hypothetical protein ASG41_18205 [Modestobacter sp. Leaf380]|nr:hypothetical protein ASG41_18205 [Modestobacter sp. Leaf380]